jgi:hypothetical protein
MDAMAIALVFLLSLAAGAAMGLVAWGLVLEARSNRAWRSQALVQ